MNFCEPTDIWFRQREETYELRLVWEESFYSPGFRTCFEGLTLIEYDELASQPGTEQILGIWCMPIGSRDTKYFASQEWCYGFTTPMENFTPVARGRINNF